MRTLMLFLLIFAGITSTYSQPFDKGQEIYLKSFKDKKQRIGRMILMEILLSGVVFLFSQFMFIYVIM